ncbi:MAG TPA: LysM peptidoglycan-binding domain-containing protein, partial [Blastocatellia bacterium]
TLYSALFGSVPLDVPVMYATHQNDSLASISALEQYSQYNLTPTLLAENNSDVWLNPGADLVAPNRPYVTHDGYTLNQIATEWRCTVVGIATANHGTQNILKAGNTITINKIPYTVASTDTFDSVVTAFGQQGVALTVDELAQAIQNMPSVFIDGVTIEITDIVAQEGDSATQPPYTTHDKMSLAQIASELNRSVIGLAIANHNIPGILQQGVTLKAFNGTAQVGANDTFDSMAAALSSKAGQPVTVADVAVMNQNLSGIFNDGVSVQVTQQGDSFASLSQFYEANGFSVDGLAQSNSQLLDIFAAGTALFIGSNPVPAQSSDTLSSYAQNNNVTIAQLAAYNSKAAFVSGVKLDIPYLVTNASQSQYSIYVAAQGDTLAGIAAKFPSGSPAVLAELNQDLQGLFAPLQPITTSGKTVTTGTGDTFNSIIAKFSTEGVTLSLDQLASIIASQSDLLETKGVWITPPMAAANGGGASQNTLSGLAAKYNLDPVMLAQANAAAQGFLAGGVTLTFEGQTVVTNSNDTFNSLVTRFNQLGVTATVSTLATAFEDVNNLLNPASMVVPLPAATSVEVSITPDFSQPIFELIVDVAMRRNPAFVDPDFIDVTSVSQSITPVSPEPDPSGNGVGLSLTEFAASFQQAMPGLYVATGEATGEFDSTAARKIWVVNFGNSTGQQFNYKFAGANNLIYFAVPPLSTSLISGEAQIKPYVSGQGLSDDAKTVTFQSVDLDVWASTFLDAVDLFLSPSYAVPAYNLDAQHTAYDNVVSQKGTIATAIKNKVEQVLQNSSSPDPDALTDAQATLEQALLVELANAYAVNSLVQVPVTISAGS